MIRIALPILCLILAGCDKAPPAGSSAVSLPKSLDGTGIVQGIVRFVGQPPTPRPITPNDAHCFGDEPLVDESIVVAPGGLLRNTFIHLSGAPATDGSEVAPALLDQVKCRYTPHALGVQVGQTLRIRSSDATMHNVHFVPQKNQARNFGMTQVGDEVKVTFTSPEFIRMKCDVHPWMTAWVGVFDNPLFAVSGDDGAFQIKGIPAGTYKLVAWHEALGTREQRLTVVDDKPIEVTFSFGNAS